MSATRNDRLDFACDHVNRLIYLIGWKEVHSFNAQIIQHRLGRRKQDFVLSAYDEPLAHDG